MEESKEEQNNLVEMQATNFTKPMNGQEKDRTAINEDTKNESTKSTGFVYIAHSIITI